IDIFRQTYGWMSGFANYNVSTFLVLLIFYLVFIKEYKAISVLFVLILSFASQFFAENVSIVNVILSVIGILYFLITNRKKVLLPVAWLIGSSIGYWIMFQNTAYHSESTRGLSNIYFSEFFKHLLQDWSELVIKQNIVLI
ncbi:hypothetical protein, partial [Acinetobacter baumannii]|uniref:hypothetical protein n=1 Tax=Acinetobacter baumannii TaxID=470 RepID=UPI001AECE95A